MKTSSYRIVLAGLAFLVGCSAEAAPFSPPDTSDAGPSPAPTPPPPPPPAPPSPPPSPSPTGDAGTDGALACRHAADARVVASSITIPQPDSCTNEAIGRFRAACFDGGLGSAACAALEQSAATCGKCILGSATSVGAVFPWHGGKAIPNVWSCMSTKAGRSDCTLAVGRQVACVTSVCGGCSDADWKSCVEPALEAECKAASVEGTACKSVLSEADKARPADIAPLCFGATMGDTFELVARALCGPRSLDDGGPVIANAK